MGLIMHDHISIRRNVGGIEIEVRFPPQTSNDRIEALLDHACTLIPPVPAPSRITPDDVEAAHKAGVTEGLRIARESGERWPTDALARLALLAGVAQSTVNYRAPEALEQDIAQGLASAKDLREVLDLYDSEATGSLIQRVEAIIADTEKPAETQAVAILAMGAACDEAIRLLGLPDQPIAVIREGIVRLITRAREDGSESRALALVHNRDNKAIRKALGERNDGEKDVDDLVGSLVHDLMFAELDRNRHRVERDDLQRFIAKIEAIACQNVVPSEAATDFPARIVAISKLFEDRKTEESDIPF